MRVLEHLKSATRDYPNAWAQADEFRRDRGVDLPKWPAWCFLPLAGWYAIVSGGGKLDLMQSSNIARLAALGPWRYTQGIYQFEPHLLSALTDTIIKGEMPSEVFYRLPEWSLYFETPGRTWLGETLHGFFAHLEWDANTERTELRLLIDSDIFIPVALHVGPWTVTESVDRYVAEAGRNAAIQGIDFTPPPELIQKISEEINPLLSLILYVCSDEPEIDNFREPGTSPHRPKPTKTKNGWKLFPPSRPTIWSVGTSIGEELRRAESEGDGDESGRRAHLRRGHWHGYWVGPRDGERRFKYNWLHPMIVGGGDE